MWHYGSLAPPGAIPHYLNTSIHNVVNGELGMADHNDACVACFITARAKKLGAPAHLPMTWIAVYPAMFLFYYLQFLIQ